VWSEIKSVTIAPQQADVESFAAYMEQYKQLLQVEQTAIEVL